MSAEKYTKKNSEIIVETKKFAVDLLKNPELAKKAIHDKNIIIRGLKADIEHRKLAFKEIEARYEEIYSNYDNNLKQNENFKLLIENQKNEIENLKTSLNTEEEKFYNLKLEFETYKFDNKNFWKEKVYYISEIFPDKLGKIIRFIFTPPFSTYMWLILFCLFFVSSIIGWKAVCEIFLVPIAHVIKIFIPGE